MVSAFTQRGADVTVRALQAGAFDFVTKPAGVSPEDSLAKLRREVTSRIRVFLARRHRTGEAARSTLMPVRPTTPPAAHGPAGATHLRTIRAVLIGCSTGGPKALASILPQLTRRVDAPIVVVQHMPAEFTRSLAENLARQSGVAIVEAEDGRLLEPRTVYIAPGGKHLVLRRDAHSRLVAGTNDQPPEQGCRPSASVLFRSAAAVLGGAAVAVVLTGMGNDGTAGLGPFKRAGGYVIAQDEATSVVWGMPGSAVEAGFVDAILPLAEIAATVQALCGPRGAN
jgi:two-component system chemotaxis response regulator CheB